MRRSGRQAPFAGLVWCAVLAVAGLLAFGSHAARAQEEEVVGLSLPLGRGPSSEDAAEQEDNGVPTEKLMLATLRDPDNVRLRFVLAARLAREGNYRASAVQLRRLLRNAPPGSTAERLLQEALTGVMRKTPWDLTVYGAMLPSTNINRAASAEYFVTGGGLVLPVTDGGEPKAGVGLRGGLRGSYTYAMARGMSVTGSARVQREWFPVPRLSNWNGELRLSFGRVSAGRNLNVSAYVNRTIYDAPDGATMADLTRYGLSLGQTFFLKDNRSITAVLRGEKRVYDEKTGLNGPFGALSVIWSDMPHPRMRYAISYGLSGYWPETESSAYIGNQVTGRVFYRTTPKLTLGGEVGLGVRNYRADFLTLDYPRRDTFWSVGLNVSHRDIRVWGTIPRLSCAYQKTLSNISLYEYDSVNCSVSIVTDF